VPTPFGRISKFAAAYIMIAVFAIAFGLVVPDRTGEWFEIGGWLAVVLPVIAVGLRTTPLFGDPENEEPQRPPRDSRR
jgi:hypothetical protein